MMRMYWGHMRAKHSDYLWLLLVDDGWKPQELVIDGQWLPRHPGFLSILSRGFIPSKTPHFDGPQAAQAQAGAIRGPYEQQLMIQSYRMHVVWLCNVRSIRSQKTEASVTASQLSYRLRMTDLQYHHCGRTSLSWGSNRSKRMTSLRKSLS